jgi:hypothetical protein
MRPGAYSQIHVAVMSCHQPGQHLIQSAANKGPAFDTETLSRMPSRPILQRQGREGKGASNASFRSFPSQDLRVLRLEKLESRRAWVITKGGCGVCGLRSSRCASNLKLSDSPAMSQNRFQMCAAPAADCADVFHSGLILKADPAATDSK